MSNDAKWNNHIENIILSVSRYLGILRKLKYRSSRQNLEKLYLVYIRPIFEYAREIWDNCEVPGDKHRHIAIHELLCQINLY